MVSGVCGVVWCGVVWCGDVFSVCINLFSWLVGWMDEDKCMTNLIRIMERVSERERERENGVTKANVIIIVLAILSQHI